MPDDIESLAVALEYGVPPQREAVEALLRIAGDLEFALVPPRLEPGLRRHLWQRSLKMTEASSFGTSSWPRRHPRSAAAIIGGAVLVGAAAAMAVAQQRRHQRLALLPR